MVDRDSAERAVKDANPIIDGRKANVNLAYLGAKPRNGFLQNGTSPFVLLSVQCTLCMSPGGLSYPLITPMSVFSLGCAHCNFIDKVSAALARC